MNPHAASQLAFASPLRFKSYWNAAHALMGVAYGVKQPESRRRCR